MKVGVKVGPANWKDVLNKVAPECAEVWFRLDMMEDSVPIFGELNNKDISFGIHFWAILKTGYEPNLAYERDGIAKESENLVKQTIDIASDYGASYVNIHPGSMLLKKLDLENKTMTVLRNFKISKQEAMQSLLARISSLHSYARKRDVLLLSETLPSCELEHWRDDTGRVNVQQAENITSDMMINLANAGYYITNDFGHTISSKIFSDRKFLFDNLFSVTKQLSAQTKLIHLNTVRPPFNGTDSHNGVLEKDFKQNVLPNKKQISKLLNLFENRDDVWIIPEPQIEDMVENYLSICEVVGKVKI